jgi:guanine deaminase
MCFSAIHWARIKTIYFSNSRWDAEKIGFDDAELYDEVRKSSDQRKMTMIHLPNKVATAAFSEWENKVDKICY